MENQTKKEEEEMDFELKRKKGLLRLIVSFFFLIYGLLALVEPERYRLGVPIEYAPLVAFFLMFVGLYLFLK